MMTKEMARFFNHFLCLYKKTFQWRNKKCDLLNKIKLQGYVWTCGFGCDLIMVFYSLGIGSEVWTGHVQSIQRQYIHIPIAPSGVQLYPDQSRMMPRSTSIPQSEQDNPSVAPSGVQIYPNRSRMMPKCTLRCTSIPLAEQNDAHCTIWCTIIPQSE